MAGRGRRNFFSPSLVFCREQRFLCAGSSQQYSAMVATHMAQPQVDCSQFFSTRVAGKASTTGLVFLQRPHPLLGTSQSQPCRDFFLSRFLLCSLPTAVKGDGGFLICHFCYLRIFFYLFYTVLFKFSLFKVLTWFWCLFWTLADYNVPRLENQNAWVQILALILPNSIISLPLL